MKTLKKLKKSIRKFPQAKNLLKWERLQAHQNYLKGFYKGLKVESEIRAFWMLVGAVGVAVIYFILVWLI